MRRLLIGLTLLTALGVVQPVAAATRTVTINRSSFTPPSITVAFGDTVRWRNADTRTHQVVADNGTFASPLLGPGRTYSFTFRASGTYRYRDSINGFRGTIVVRGAPPSISAGVSQSIVVSGTAITVGGVVSNRRAGETVTVLARPYPQTSFLEAVKVVTSAGGVWSYVTTPSILTAYQATWNGATSLEVTAAVRPKISFGRSGAFVVRVTSGARGFAGKQVQLQRLNQLGVWVTLCKPRLNAASAARFRCRVPLGLSRLRIAMSVNQAGAGLMGGFSSEIVFRRRS